MIVNPFWLSLDAVGSKAEKRLNHQYWWVSLEVTALSDQSNIIKLNLYVIILWRI